MTENLLLEITAPNDKFYLNNQWLHLIGWALWRCVYPGNRTSISLEIYNKDIFMNIPFSRIIDRNRRLRLSGVKCMHFKFLYIFQIYTFFFFIIQDYKADRLNNMHIVLFARFYYLLNQTWKRCGVRWYRTSLQNFSTCISITGF